MKSRVVTHIEVEHPEWGEIEVECHVEIDVDRGGRDFPASVSAELIEAFVYDAALTRFPYELSDADAERACEKAVEEYENVA